MQVINHRADNNKRFILELNKNQPYLLYILFGLSFTLGAWNFFATRDKIVYVDTGKLFQTYNDAVKINNKLEKQAKEYEANVDTLILEMQEALKDYEKDVPKMQNSQRIRREQEIDEKRVALQRYQVAVKEKLEQQRNEAFTGVVQTVNSFLSDYGKRKGYRMILIANPSGTIGYAKEGTDITADIVAELNQKN